MADRKISMEDIPAIFKAYENGWTQIDIAKNYGVSQNTIYNILHKKTYKKDENKRK